VFAGFLFACETDEETIKMETKAIIDGKEFTPTDNSIKISGKNLIILFKEGSKTLEIVTNDTIPETYNIVTEQLKSSSFKANIEYNDGTEMYYGISGTVTLEKSGNMFSGSYMATVKSENNNTEIEISSGSFSDIESSVELLITTETAINDTLVSCYSLLTEYIQFEFLFDAIYSNQTIAPSDNWSDIYAHSQDPSNVKIAKLWSDAWDIMFQTNLIILSATEFVSDELTRNQILGQAKSIQAYTSLKLLKWFGEIPIITEQVNSFPPRNTVEEVTQWIIDNTQEAELYLPEIWPSSDENRITKIFAKSILHRIYLFNKNYNEAYNTTQQIINSDTYSLSITTENFQENNVEFYWGFAKGNNQEFNDFFDKGLFVPVLRYTETILSNAEAAFMLGNNTEAFNSINMLRARRGQPDIANIGMDIILDQYKIELLSEGDMFLFLKRFDKANEELQLFDIRILLPIPQSVIENNPNLYQNPGY